MKIAYSNLRLTINLFDSFSPKQNDCIVARLKMTTLQRRSVLVTSFVSARDYIVLLHNGIKKLSFENSFFIWG